MIPSVPESGEPSSPAPAPASAAPGEPSTPSSPAGPVVPNAKRDLITAAVVSLLACAAARLAPREHEATAVGAVFLGATWLLVLRGSAASIRDHGLGLGGLLEPERLDLGRLARSAVRALGWAGAAAAITWPFFAIGLPIYYGASKHFVFPPVKQPFDLVLGQVFVIALPEEAFFRGFLQSRLDAVWPRRWRILGTDVGASIVATSVMFAVAHVLTLPLPARLAVFFPSLLFGWLRARTRGIGAGLVFHAGCNILSILLRDGYGV